MIDDTRHILHNFLVADFDGTAGDELVTASREGLTLLTRGPGGTWSRRLLVEGRLAKSRWGASADVASSAPSSRGMARPSSATWKVQDRWARTVVDDAITGGHAVAWADFDGDGDDELVAGWRDGTFGLARYRIGSDGSVRARQVIDRGVAVEDLVVADLNADGRPDIVAGGRSTGNIRLFINERAGR